MADRIIIFDTTLRDGEQAPGFSLTVPEKLQLARQLDVLGVDVIEAGFPIASEADAEADGEAELEGVGRFGRLAIEAQVRLRRPDELRARVLHVSQMLPPERRAVDDHGGGGAAK